MIWGDEDPYGHPEIGQRACAPTRRAPRGHPRAPRPLPRRPRALRRVDRRAASPPNHDLTVPASADAQAAVAADTGARVRTSAMPADAGSWPAQRGHRTWGPTAAGPRSRQSSVPHGCSHELGAGDGAGGDRSRTTSATARKTPARLLFTFGSNVVDDARKFGDGAARTIGTALLQDACTSHERGVAAFLGTR